MASGVSLGVFQLTENVNFRFQYQDITGALVNPSSPPVYKLYAANSVSSSLVTNPMSVGEITGQYIGVVDVSDYDGLGTPLPHGRYTIEVYTPDPGISNHTIYSFQVNEVADIVLDAVLYAFIQFMSQFDDGSGQAGPVISGWIWDALKADHVIADTFGEATLSKTNLDDLLSALSITSGFTAGNDIETIKEKIDTLEKVAVGRWRIDVSARQLVFYELDGSTELMRFDLTDAEGDPTTTNVADRNPA